MLRKITIFHALLRPKHCDCYAELMFVFCFFLIITDLGEAGKAREDDIFAVFIMRAKPCGGGIFTA
ncbi:Uncharacterized protein dnm_066430 [Desulfonema magnum]|uniref:Uncharacterized protein n=1 Tax=Desulfonema magnum TaxID=45655 RepID=A0A975GS04_9BACT|nr:Uncharacterized protein dnm_066430 [Desulfonema magnum]